MMHPRNPYETPPDFAALAEAFPPLKPWLVTKPDGTCTIDFHNETAQRSVSVSFKFTLAPRFATQFAQNQSRYLTKALLHRDFDIALELPADRLCPPVPNRLNYVLWIQDIIRIVYEGRDTSNVVHGIDIGTGASVIYPLLACRVEPDWRFTVTEIDETSIRFARQNIESNNLSDRISLVAATQDGPILSPLVLYPTTIYDFTMCNPPFYGSAQEVADLADAKQATPNAICTGAEVEMITVGGESEFVCKMVRESLEHRSRCRWYTSMMGRMTSLFTVVTLLHQHKINNYAITEFVQGQTRRWGIAWSFTDIRLPDDIARTSSHALQDIMAPRNNLRQPFSGTYSAQEVVDALKATLASIDVNVSFQHGVVQPSSNPSFIVCTTGNTWSRAARRGNKKVTAATTSSPPSVKCSILVKGEGENGLRLEFRWIQGDNRAVYESFVSHVSRKVDLRLGQAQSAYMHIS